MCLTVGCYCFAAKQLLAQIAAAAAASSTAKILQRPISISTLAAPASTRPRPVGTEPQGTLMSLMSHQSQSASLEFTSAGTPISSTFSAAVGFSAAVTTDVRGPAVAPPSSGVVAFRLAGAMGQGVRLSASANQGVRPVLMAMRGVGASEGVVSVAPQAPGGGEVMIALSRSAVASVTLGAGGIGLYRFLGSLLCVLFCIFSNQFFWSINGVFLYL